MYVSLSKTIARFGGFRLSVGMRLNKKNSAWIGLLLLFVAMFQLMWYAVVLCGWLMYVMCYGFYYCAKKILGTKKENKALEDQEKIAATENDDLHNDNFNNQQPGKIPSVVRWIVGGIFTLFALVNGFHYSSLFLLLAAFLMFPFSFSETFCQKKHIKKPIVFLVAVVLFFVGALTSPPVEPADPSDKVTTQATSNMGGTTSSVVTTTMPITTSTPVTTTAAPVTTTAAPATTTKKPAVTTAPEEKVEMVWISSSGKKYHSKSSCSGMKSPSSVSIDYAKQHGYTACSKCH